MTTNKLKIYANARDMIATKTKRLAMDYAAVDGKDGDIFVRLRVDEFHGISEHTSLVPSFINPSAWLKSTHSIIALACVVWSAMKG
jgi:hypothetical protein